ncbi:TetR family transcriptional regulator [Nonomuraea sp. NN258]|uniref:TetR/AcrR family transcriptional regulator n=1 Tax=Nonomuraea antri TaxID=2730852 RepID=UPI00156A5CD7|nr:TetR/AcrR family transcriptional regulator [Nonomuraea antri]NRQ39657.1 TetR family transcriptional regulator [Nonomuraea antri]
MAGQDRRAVLADVAIELVATQGIRALTHRAVDAAAGMPIGTTSAYFRTRKALLTGLVRRMADLDEADLKRHGVPSEPPGGRPRIVRVTRVTPVTRVTRFPARPLPPKTTPATDVSAASDGLTGADLDRVAGTMAVIIDHWLGPARNRSLARYACSLEAVHLPELRDLLSPHHAASQAALSALIARAGVPDPDRRARDFGSYVDGLILRRVLGMAVPPPPPPGTPESVAELRGLLRALLTSVIGLDELSGAG